MNSKEISANIKAERNRCNLTIKDVSKITGISQQTLMKYERNAGKVKVDLLIKLASLYKCTLKDFLLTK